MKNYFSKTAFLFLLFFLTANPVLAESPKVNLYFFYSKTCPHCLEEEIFLETLESKFSNLVIKGFEVSDKKNILLAQRAREALGIRIAAVPLTVAGDHYVLGYRDAETTGREILALVNYNFKESPRDIIGEIIDEENKPSPSTEDQKYLEAKLPLLGKIDLKMLSLPVLTVVIGLMDGFNPCAMWVLVFLISLLLGMKDRKRMWILGSAFIGASGLVYFLFMSAWLNFFLFIGFVNWVRIMVGLVALAVGGYNLWEYERNKKGLCHLTSGKKTQRVFSRLKSIVQEKKIFFALAGITALALAVNLVELVCSAGFPAIYTQVLSLAKLPNWQYYLYLILYLIFFMLDDMLVFAAAMVTLKKVAINTKYGAISRLIGGILMLIIGLLLLLKPEWLIFG